MSLDPKVEAQFKDRCLQRCNAATDPLERLRLGCLARGVKGIKQLGRTFRIMDDSHDLRLNYDEFSTGLNDYKVRLGKDDMQQLFNRIDRDGTGSISFDEFLIALRPPLSQRRKALIDKAFQKLDMNGNGVITVSDIKRIYDPKHHRKFMSGEWTDKQVFQEFLGTFDSPNNKDYIVTQEEFFNYYCGVSASIDSDPYFDLMMRKAWRL